MLTLQNIVENFLSKSAIVTIIANTKVAKHKNGHTISTILELDLLIIHSASSEKSHTIPHEIAPQRYPIIYNDTSSVA
jgi:hypothetical protein